MKVLWLVNIIMPELAEHLKINSSVFGGWLIGAERAVKETNNSLVICSTSDSEELYGRYRVNDTIYYIVKKSSIDDMSASFEKILNDENPDVIHIYGTEFAQCLAMARVSPVSKTLVTIQGALCICKDLAYAGIPDKICDDNVCHKLLRKLHKGGESIQLQKNSFEERAIYEEETLKTVKYINGGSEWGNSVARSVNPGCITMDCNLILRDSFYNSRLWNYEECEKHTIYALYSYPIKGFHKLIEAAAIVRNFYPDVKIKAIANRQYYRKYNKIKTRILDKAPDYQWYIQGLIEKYELKNNIEFLGRLSEEQVKQELYNANVFVSASSIENQSTALGEAMILGVPGIASFVGAIPEMIDNGTDGFTYPFNESHLLADCICRLFENPGLAKQFSVKGHEHAAKTYDREKNKNDLINMYNTIYNNSKSEVK